MYAAAVGGFTPHCMLSTLKSLNETFFAISTSPPLSVRHRDVQPPQTAYTTGISMGLSIQMQCSSIRWRPDQIEHLHGGGLRVLVPSSSHALKVALLDGR